MDHLSKRFEYRQSIQWGGLALAEGQPTGNGRPPATQPRLSREHIEQAGRARLLEATRQILAELGPEGVTVGAVAERARVPRSVFYRMFPGIQECILAAVREIFDGLDIAASAALLGDGPWRDGVRAALVELMVSIGPYLDAPAVRLEIERARREARIRAQTPAEAVIAIPPPLSDFRAHRMRDCVRYLAQHPGASNMQIGRAIDCDHAGQLSTILKRLLQAGLLIKTAGRSGQPNAWTLSSTGLQAAAALEQASQTFAHT
jgi:AcrR family transcriptional regulator